MPDVTTFRPDAGKESERKKTVNAIRPVTLAVVVIAFCLLPSSAAPAAGDTAAFFPDMDGWRKDGGPESYVPENLYEYINGAADVYLSYEFEELATLAYDGGGKRSLSIDIYRHADLRNAFGIYSQEKPRAGEFLPIGTEGYYEKGVLNFFHDRYYVKLIGVYLEEEDEEILKAVAGEVAERLGGQRAFPGALECFPVEGKLPGSERFLAQDVLGHGFLHSAYTADYDLDGSATRVFLFEARDDTDAADMFDKYLELARASGPVIVDGGTCRFSDPRRSSAERFNLRRAGRYLWGLSANDADTADRFLDAIEESLTSRGLIE